MSVEYGTGTIRATLSATPRRPSVLVTKAAVFGAVVLVVSTVTAFLAFFVGQALLTAPATHATLSTPETLRQIFGTAVYLLLVGLFALALATIIRHTAGAISTFVAILLVAPTLLQALPSSIFNDLDKFMPSRIGEVALSIHHHVDTFSPWAGLLIMAAYTLGLLVLGGVLMVRRDA